jgi:uncharacterized protein involved in type VI secretion and phage assembly
VAVGVVTNNIDPDELGRVRVEFPWLERSDSYWARIAVLMAGKDRGTFFIPEVGDEVLVAFEAGNIRYPYVIGALWNGQDIPPETNSDGENNIRVIKSRSGHKILLDDKEGCEKIEFIDKSEKNIISIDTKDNTITISSDKDIIMKAPNGKISLECMEFEAKSYSIAEVEASAGLKLRSGGTTSISGTLVTIN